MLTKTEFHEIVQQTKTLLRLAQEQEVFILPGIAFAIGVFRHGGRIPWDTDEDLFYDTAKKPQIVDRIFPEMYRLHNVTCKFHIPNTVTMQIPNSEFHIGCDQIALNPMHRERKGWRIEKTYWKNIYFVPNSMLYPLRKMPYHNYMVDIPRAWPHIYDEILVKDSREGDQTTWTWSDTMKMASIGHSHGGTKDGHRICPTCDRCPMRVPIDSITYLKEYDPLDYLHTLPFPMKSGEPVDGVQEPALVAIKAMKGTLDTDSVRMTKNDTA